MPRRDVVLTEHQDALVQDLVRTGRYADAGEVFGDALRLIERRETVEQAKLIALRGAVQSGIDAIDRGEYIEFETADEMIAYLTAATDDLLEVRDGDDA